MEILLHCLFSVHLVDGTLSDDVVSVVETVMLDVVAEGGHQERESVGVVEAGVFLQVLIVQD